MTDVTLTQDSILPERTNYDLQLERDPTAMDTIRAFAKDTPGGAAFMNIANSFNHPVVENDPKYDVFSDPRWNDSRYAGYIDRAIGIESKSGADLLFNKFDSEADNRAVMAASGTAMGIAASIVTSPLDPISYVPVGGAAYKTYRTGENILKGAARTAATMAVASTASETVMHSLQETRTKEESAWNVAGATFLGGVIGGAASAFGGGKNLAKLSERVDEELKVPPSALNDSVGAARTPTTTLSDEALKTAGGLEKLFSFQDPLLRTANSPSKTVRTSMEKLAESTLVRNKNTQGIATEVSVENRIKSYELPKYMYIKERDKQFLEYRNSSMSPTVGMAKRGIAIKDFATNQADRVFNRSRPDAKLTYQEFKEEVVKAGRRNDQHDIPQVAAAARAKREMVTDPIFKSAKDVGLIDADTAAPSTAASYVNRLWDHGAIKANRREFEEVNANWLKTKRDKAASDLDGMFKEFDLNQNSRVSSAVKAERDAFKTTKASAKEAATGAADSASKEKSLRLSVDELETRLNDATKNQQRIYSKILNKRERGDSELTDLFNEFRSVSSAKKELYKRVALKEEKANAHSVEAVRRQAIADHLSEQERLLEEKLAKLEDQTKLMEDLEYRSSFDDGDLGSVAYKLTDRILGTSVGRLSYDNKIRTGKGSGRAGKRGPAKARVYDIPDEMVEKFLVNDDDHLLESYVRSLSSDIELTKTFGSVDPEDALKAIQDDYESLEHGISDSAVLEKLRGAKNNDLRDFNAVWERLRGTYGNNGDDYASGWRSTERALMNVNYLSMLGGMTLSAFADVARPVMVHGLQRTMGDGFGALLTNTKAFMKAAGDVKEASTALDMATNTRAKALFGADEFMPFQNKVEAITGNMAQNFGVISLMAPWNAAMKQFAGVITQNRIMKAINKIADGKSIGAKETEYLAANFIDESMAKKIAAQFKDHGEIHDSVHIPNARDWKDTKAAETFRAAIRKQVDQIIVTPGQDKPLWMSKSGWRLMGQFRSFSIASMQRTMLAGLQQRDMAVLNGTVLSVALGTLSYMAKAEVSGYNQDMSASRLLREGVDRSGVLAWLTDANAIAEKVSRGRVGVNAIMGGPPLSRYASRSALEAVFGPTYGMAGNLVQVGGNALAGDWQAADTHTVRRMMPYNNLFYVRSIFDDAEKGINETLGVKGK